MLHHILILLFLNTSFKLTQSLASKRFFCDSQADIDEFNNLDDHFKRLVKHQNKIYFIFKNRIIFTELFRIDEEELKYYDSATMLMKPFYEIENIENDSIDGIPAGSHVIGHIHNEKLDKIYEFYSDKNEKINQLSYELNFEKMPAIRQNAVKLEDIKSSFLNASSEIAEVQGHTNKSIYFDFSEYSDNRKVLVTYEKDYFNFYVKSTKETHEFKRNFWQEPVFFVAYLKNQRDDHYKTDYTLISLSISRETYQVDFANFLFKGTNIIRHDSLIEIQEFFSCHQQFQTGNDDSDY